MKIRILACLLTMVLLLCSFVLPAWGEEAPATALITVTLGDVTGDDKTDAADALQLLLYAVQKPSSIYQVKNAGLMADVDGNNTMDAADALEILQKAVGIREEFTAVSIEAPAFPWYQEDFDWFDKNQGFLANSSKWPWPSLSAEESARVYRSVYYHYGPAAAPEMLEQIGEYWRSLEGLNSDASIHSFSASLLPLFNLQINLHSYVNDYWNLMSGDEEQKELMQWDALYQQILDFAASVPGRVNELCDSTTLTQEEKVFELSKLGLLALPYLQERMEKGETQWEICFANQLLGVSDETRLQTLLGCYDLDHVWITQYSEQTEQQVYAKKTAAALPVDALWWCQAHAQELMAMKAWCEGTGYLAETV